MIYLQWASCFKTYKQKRMDEYIFIYIHIHLKPSTSLLGVAGIVLPYISAMDRCRSPTSEPHHLLVYHRALDLHHRLSVILNV